MTPGDRLRASGPIMADNASWKSPVEMPFRYRTGNSPSRLTEHRAHFGNMVDVKRILSAGSGVAIRSRSLGRLDIRSANSRLDLPLWPKSMPHNPLSAILQMFSRKTGDKPISFRFQRFPRHPVSIFPGKICQSVRYRSRLAKRQDRCIVLHRRIAPCRVLGQVLGQVLAGFNTRHNTPPFKSRHHTYFRIAQNNGMTDGTIVKVHRSGRGAKHPAFVSRHQSDQSVGGTGHHPPKRSLRLSAADIAT